MTSSTLPTNQKSLQREAREVHDAATAASRRRLRSWATALRAAEVFASPGRQGRRATCFVAMSSTDAISCLVFGSATRLRSAIGLRRSQAEEAVTVPARASHRFGDLR